MKSKTQRKGGEERWGWRARRRVGVYGSESLYSRQGLHQKAENVQDMLLGNGEGNDLIS